MFLEAGRDGKAHVQIDELIAAADGAAHEVAQIVARLRRRLLPILRVADAVPQTLRVKHRRVVDRC